MYLKRKKKTQNEMKKSFLFILPLFRLLFNLLFLYHFFSFILIISLLTSSFLFLPFPFPLSCRAGKGYTEEVEGRLEGSYKKRERKGK
jgi:hypothetical protein